MFNILIVDDETLDREGISCLITRYDLPLRIFEASNGNDALRILMNNRIDILFTDIKMPLMSGIELSKRSLKINRELLVIIFSSFADFKYAQSAMSLGISHYLLKPLKISEFLNVMHDIIEQCREMERRYWSKHISLLLNAATETGVKVEQLRIWPYGKTILLIDFRKGLSEESFRIAANIVNKNLKSENFFVNLNECQVLVFSTIHYENLIKKTYKILDDFKEKHLTDVFIVLGGELLEFNLLTGIFNKMQELVESKFFTKDNMVLSIYQDVHNATLKTRYTSEKKDEIILMIRHNNVMGATLSIDELFALMQKEGMMSVLYVKYIIYEIVKEFYDHHKKLDSTLYERSIREIFSAEDIFSLKEVCRNCINVNIEEETEQTDVVSKKVIDVTLEILHSDYMKDINLESVAERVLYTPNYLSHLFKKHTGQNFMKYLTDYRISKAKELLKTTEMKINTIGSMVGYKQTSYFCTIFRNYTGVTPAQYRERSI